MRLMVWLMLLVAIGACSNVARSQPVGVPPGAVKLLPVLKREIMDNWTDLYPKSILAAQVEQESCISLKHRRCWNERAELKTDREYGFGLGQLTVTSRFNAFEEVKRMDRSLRDWRWDDRFNPTYQLRAIVVMMRNLYRSTAEWTSDHDTRLAFAASAYNGGRGGLIKDRILCRNTKGCNPAIWFGHVEHTSFRSKTAVKGYGKSFFDINREYVRMLINVEPRRKKYIPYMDQTAGI